jgi:23S rRNA pseudouridine1911/1915/1917 synthase
MVVTKSDRAHRGLARQFLEHETRKDYIAYAGKRPGAADLADQGAFKTLFGRHPTHRKRFSSRVERGKQAHTDYQVLSRFAGKDFNAVKVRASPVTGRTHQIRVHLADAGHPILGDKLYGGRSSRVYPQSILPARPALHAVRLTFVHPVREESMSFEAPLPRDMELLERALKDG